MCILVSTPSKYDKAMSVYKNHYSTRALKKAFNSATTQDDSTPSPTAMTTLLTTLTTSPTTPLTTTLLPLLRALPLPYKPFPMETTASIHSPLGNSIHSPSSAAHRALVLHGIRIFKALTLLHEILRARAPQNTVIEDEKEELAWWFETVVHDIRCERDGERGYAALIPPYITYLSSLLSSPSSTTPLSTALTAHQNFSLASHVFRESLLLSIRAANPLHTGAQIAALELAIEDALGFGGREAELLERMRGEGVGGGVVGERERVFEMRREEVVGFMGRWEGVKRGLERGVEVEVISEKLEGLKF